MKATKAYIASAGTTGLLLASSMSLLVLVGAILAFNGWPNSGLAEDVERFFVGDDEPSVLVPGAVSQSVDTAADASGSVVGDEPLGADVDAVVADFDPAADDGSPLGGGVPGAGTPGAGTPGDGTPGGGTPVAGTPGGAPGAGGSAPQINLPVDVPGVNPESGALLSTGPLKHGLANTVNGTTDQLGGAVPGQLGSIVDQTGDALSDTVRALPDVSVGSNPQP